MGRAHRADDLLEAIGDNAGERLAFQASFPVHPVT